MMHYLEHILQNWEKSVLTFLPKVFWAIIVLFLFIMLAKFAKKICVRAYSNSIKIHPEIASIIGSILYFFLVFSGVIIALNLLGLEQMLTHLLAGAGIIGIVAGFAFKDIASNIFAGLLIKLQRPYKTNDWVNINDNYGVILEVGWITTCIKTVPGQEVFIPNQLVYNNTFTNYSTWEKRRIIFKSGVSYGDDLEHVKTVALDEVQKIPQLLSDEGIDFYYTDIGSSTYNFMLRFWIHFESNDDFCKAMSAIIMNIKKRFEQENISIAYPVTTLDFGVKGGVNIFDKTINLKT